MRITLTHKGWFGLCPVFMSDPDSDSPLVDPRHWILAPLFWLSEFMFGLMFAVMEAAGADVPGWPLKITGRLASPIPVDLPDEE